MALPIRLLSGPDMHDAVLPVDCDARIIGHARRRALHVVAVAEPEQLALGGRLRAPRREAHHVRLLHCIVEIALEVARVEGKRRCRVERHCARRHEVASAKFVRREVHLMRRFLHQPLDDIGGFRPPGATIGVHRHGVRIDRAHAVVHRRHHVDADMHAARRKRRDERTELALIRAEIGDGRNLHGEYLAVLVQRHRRFRHMVAALRIAQEAFRAVRRPLHRPPQHLRREQHQRIFGIDEGLHAEAAAHVFRHHAQLLDRNLERVLGDIVAHRMHALAAGIERVMVAIRLVVTERRARLHRVHDDAVVDELELRHMMRGLHRRFGLLRIADVPVIGEVRAVLLPDHGRTGGNRTRRIGDGGQVFIVHHHEVGRIARLRRRLGHDHRHKVAHMAHPVPRDQPARRLEDWRPVLVLQHVGGGRVDGAKPCFLGIAPRIDRDDARRCLGIFRVDPGNPRMRMRTAHHHRIGLARQRNIVRIASFSRHKPNILDAPRRLPHTELHHGRTSFNA